MNLIVLDDKRLRPATIYDFVEQRILEIGGQRREFGEDLADYPTDHEFTPGLYIRTIHVPAKSVILGHRHRTEHPWVMHTGLKWTYCEGTWELLKGPVRGITKPGMQRIGITLQDTVWSTYHPTQLTDIKEIETMLFEPSGKIVEGK